MFVSQAEKQTRHINKARIRMVPEVLAIILKNGCHEYSVKLVTGKPHGHHCQSFQNNFSSKALDFPL